MSQTSTPGLTYKLVSFQEKEVHITRRSFTWYDNGKGLKDAVFAAHDSLNMQ